MGFDGWNERQDNVQLIGVVTGDNYSNHNGPLSVDDWDWSIFVRPDPGFENLATNLGGIQNDGGIIECEIQTPNGLQDWASTHRYIDPLIGHTVTMVGTWVEDISHNSKTEIHPITSVLDEEWGNNQHTEKFITFMVFCDTYDWQPFRPNRVPHSNELRVGHFRVQFPQPLAPEHTPAFNIWEENDHSLAKDFRVTSEGNGAFLEGTVQVDREHPFYFGRIYLGYRIGHAQLMYLNRDQQPGGGRVMILDYSGGQIPGQVGYWEKWGDNGLLGGWQDNDDWHMVGDFMGLGHAQVMYINRDGNGGRVMIVDYSGGQVPGQVRYWENWGQNGLLNGWQDNDDWHMVGDFMGLGHAQVMYLNRDQQPGSGRVMILDYSGGQVPGQIRYLERWGDNGLLDGWEDNDDWLLVGRFQDNERVALAKPGAPPFRLAEQIWRRFGGMPR
jgi:hypothetical protein